MWSESTATCSFFGALRVMDSSEFCADSLNVSPMATSRTCGSAFMASIAAPDPRLPQPISPYLSVSSTPACANRGMFNAASAVVATAVFLINSRRLCELSVIELPTLVLPQRDRRGASPDLCQMLNLILSFFEPRRHQGHEIRFGLVSSCLGGYSAPKQLGKRTKDEGCVRRKLFLPSFSVHPYDCSVNCMISVVTPYSLQVSSKTRFIRLTTSVSHSRPPDWTSADAQPQ